MNAEAVAAWWGAIVSTILGVWEIVRWARSGARLRVRLASNMQHFVPGVGFNPKLHVSISISNVGDASTTITHLVACSYQNWWKWLRKNPTAQGVIEPGPSSVYPHVLEPGTRWSAWVPQEIFQEMLVKGPIVRVGVVHSMSESPATERLRLLSA